MARTIAKDHDKKRARILKIAARVFAEQGFARASMSQVAADCGISKANIYHYYSSKDRLLFDILDVYLSALRDRLAALPLDGVAPDEKLRLFVVETLLAYAGMDHEHKIQTEGIPLLSPEQQAILKGYQREMVAQLGAIVTEISPDLFANDREKLRTAVMSIFGMLNWFYMWNSTADVPAREAYGTFVATMVIKGLRSV